MTIASQLAIPRQTIDDLYRVNGKAELIDGRIVTFMANGHLPAVVAGEIFISLHAYAKAVKRGVAYGDGIGYWVPELPSGRESFSPAASYYAGALPANPMRFVEGPPTFAVEVRSENDYGTNAEATMMAKRADYFAAGTLVVWDVDPEAQTVAAYHESNPTSPVVFCWGQTADAEPALPGWTMAVADIFPR